MKKTINVFSVMGMIFAIIGAFFVLLGVLTAGIMYERGGGCTVNGEYRYYEPGVFSVPSLLFLGIFGLIGLLFLVIGVSFIVHVIRKNKRIQILLDTGKRLSATITDISYNYSVRINGCHPRVITCEYNDPYSEKIHVFRSDDVTAHIGNVLGRTISVYVQADDFSKNYVDVSELESRYAYH